MGLYAIKMPDIGEGIAEVELVAWHVQPGDVVKEDQVLADVMTDKATVEIPSPVAGRVDALGGQPGQVLAVGAELIRIEVEGAGNVKAGTEAGAQAGAGAAATAARAAPATPAAAATAGAAAAAATAPTPPASPDIPDAPDAIAAADAVAHAEHGSPPAPAAARGAVPPRASQQTAPSPPSPSSRRGAEPPRSAQPPTRAAGEKPVASPAVRRRAFELGIELQFVHGSGPAGRVTHDDLDVYLASRGQAAAAQTPQRRERDGEEAIPVVGLRRRIAQKMQEAKRRIPHFSYVEEIDVTELEALRAQINARYAAARGKLTLLPLIARAVVLATFDFPQMNARYDDEAAVVTRHRAVHLGIATQTDAGLMVPVLRHAEAQDLWGFAREVTRLAEAARSGKAARDELTGSTITITSLGALGGIVTTPVINHPEVAIVGVNRSVERPVFQHGAVVPRLLMNLSSSFDHRVVDGMDAARFVQAIRALLEHPALLFVE